MSIVSSGHVLVKRKAKSFGGSAVWPANTPPATANANATPIGFSTFFASSAHADIAAGLEAEQRPACVGRRQWV
jgi:hypothetical protein